LLTSDPAPCENARTELSNIAASTIANLNFMVPPYFD